MDWEDNVFNFELKESFQFQRPISMKPLAGVPFKFPLGMGIKTDMIHSFLFP